MKYHIFRIATVVLFVFTFIVTVGTSATHAAGVGSHHSSVLKPLVDPNDPYDSGCASGAYVARVEHIMVGNTTLATVENWYSPGCIKNWGQIEWTLGSSLGVSIVTASSILTPEKCYPTTCSGFYSGGLSPSWTNMVDGHNEVCVTGQAKYKGTIYLPLDGNRGVDLSDQNYICA